MTEIICPICREGGVVPDGCCDNCGVKWSPLWSRLDRLYRAEEALSVFQSPMFRHLDFDPKSGRWEVWLSADGKRQHCAGPSFDHVICDALEYTEIAEAPPKKDTP